MFQHLRPLQLDRAQWDDLVTEAPNGLIYGLSWYLDIVSPGWEALVRVEAGRYVAGLPLPVRAKFGFRYLQQPLFAQQLGLFARAAPTPADWQQIGQLLRRKFRIITYYSFNTGNPELLGRADQLGLPGTVARTFYLSLQPAYPQLRAGYKPNRRWRLNQARRRGLRIEPSTDIDQLVRFFADHTAPSIFGVVGEAYEYRLLRALYAAASHAGLVSLWQARLPSGEAVAMVMLLEFRGQLTYIFNSSSPAGKAAGAISVLLDDVFRRYAGGRARCFDFEAPELHDVVGVSGFYASFGSVAAPFWSVTLNRLPWPLRAARAARAALFRQLRPRPAA